MRNSIIGVALAAVLLAALFAAAHYGSHRVQNSVAVQQADPSTIKPDFIGDALIGSWKLTCGPGRELPKPRNQGAGNSEGTPPREAPPPPGWKIPRCRVLLGLKNPQVATEEVRLTFRQIGFKRVLNLFIRFVPTDVNNGDNSTLRLDQTDIPLPIRTCAAVFCLAIDSIKHVDEPMFFNARKMTLSFPSRTTGKNVTVSIPTNGMAQAIRVMRQIDK